MFALSILTAIFAAAIFSVESIVTTLAGFVLSAIGTQFFKNVAGAQGAWSVVVAIVVSVVVAFAGIFTASFIGGDGFSWDALAKQSGQIFALATLAYHILMSDAVQEALSGGK